MNKLKSYREESATYQIAITKLISTKIFSRFMKKANVQISPEQLEIMNLLLEEDGRSMQNLSTNTRRDNSATTRIIDVLERKKFVIRKAAGNDRRKKLIFITPDGKAELMKANQVARTYAAKATDGIPKDDLAQFVEVIKKIRKNIEETGKHI